jgi:hypothetical protein
MIYTRPHISEKDMPCAVCDKAISSGSPVTQVSRNKWFITSVVACSDQCVTKEKARNDQLAKSSNREIERITYLFGIVCLSRFILSLTVRLSDDCADFFTHGRCNELWNGDLADWICLGVIIVAAALATTRLQQNGRIRLKGK